MINIDNTVRLLSSGLLLLMVSGRLLADSSIAAYYTGEFLRNSKGGIAEGSVFLADAGLSLQSTIPALLGDGPATFFGYLLWNNSNVFSERFSG
ncbi:MAG: hypothetical protein KJO35_02755, partial [Gammaproteobacteria bacterium]|nr:hypothetical protein [Gammaproteobacteria bacterium]